MRFAGDPFGTRRCKVTGALTLRREFNPGPPSNPRRLNYYGHFDQGVPTKKRALKKKIDRAWDEAIVENDMLRQHEAVQEAAVVQALGGGA